MKPIKVSIFGGSMKRVIIGLIIGVMAYSQVLAATFDFDKLKTDVSKGLLSP